MEEGSTRASTSNGDGYRTSILHPKHKIFLSHSGAQKGFVEQLCVDLERCDRNPFLDKRRDSLPIGEDFPSLIFEGIEHCEVGVVVVSEEFLTSKWPMLELVAMTNVKKRNPSSYAIMPIFLGLTVSQCCDRRNHERWLSAWQTLAKSDSRIDVHDWESALQLFIGTRGLEYDSELGAVKFREEIVDAICKLVPPETRLEDSHIQGRSRLCKMIREKIKQSSVSCVYGVRVVGLYGVGGIGKTTICKAMCNDLSKDFRDKVVHVELESRSEDELLKEVLRRLTNITPALLGAMNLDECQHRLARDLVNVGVFLTVDNLSSATTNQALTLIRANYGPGSVVLVAARSLDELTCLRINERECLEMPELDIEEAKSLFLHHAACVPEGYSNSKADNELISACVERCYFGKDGGIRSQYHPLSLQTLGEQLGRVGYVRERWWALLDEINFFNPFGEAKNPVFSSLRKSFDALNAQDQLLFMDAALFVPYSIASYDFDMGYKWNVFEWFGMVHGIPLNTVIERLGNLKAKSLLESIGNGFSGIQMHDLWREFAKLETKVGDFQRRRWVFEWEEHNMHEEGHVTSQGGLSVNVRRMFFRDLGFEKVQEVKLDCFPNVTVLKLSRHDASPRVLDVSGLKELKSLELEGKEVPILFAWQRKSTISVGLVGLGCFSKLGFLRWSNIPSDSPCIDEIGRLTNLRVLDLFGGGRLPDVSSLVSLRMACFRDNEFVETFTGLSSKHTNLSYLDFHQCPELQSCPGVSELVALRELRFCRCYKLKEVPNLEKLKRLLTLRVSGCHSITALPGLNELAVLQVLEAMGCRNLAELPNMRNLTRLRVLDLRYCNLLEALPGLDEMVSLQSLKVACENLTQLPDMRKLTNLKCLELDPNRPLLSAAGLGELISLQTLEAGFDELQDWPDLRKLSKLEKLHIAGWHVEAFSSLANFVLLGSVYLRKCTGVRALPDLRGLTRLMKLNFVDCEFEDMSGLSNLTSLQNLDISSCHKLEAVPDLCKLVRLESLRVVHCSRLRDFRGVLALRNLRILWAGGYPWLHENLGPDLGRLTGLRFLDVSEGGFADLQGLAACSQLQTLNCRGCPVEELPDLANFPDLVSLNVRDCVNLKNFTCTGTLSPRFSDLDVQGCRNLRGLPPFANSRVMRELNVANSGFVPPPLLIAAIKAQWPTMYLVTELPDDQPGESVPAQSVGVQGRRSVIATFLFSLLRCCTGME